MKFPSGIIASCNTTYGANMGGYYRVHAQRERSSSHRHSDTRTTLDCAHRQRSGYRRISTEHDPAHFTRQANYFADCIQQKQNTKALRRRGLKGYGVDV